MKDKADKLYFTERLFESSPVAMIYLSRTLRITMINRAANELVGYPNSFLYGRRISSIMKWNRLKKVFSNIRDGKLIPLMGYPTRFINRCEKEVPVRLRISSMKDECGEIEGYLLTAVDMREVKDMQIGLLEAERFTAITETAVSVKHEINNPLCSILGNIQLILMENNDIDPANSKRLKSIEKQIYRIQQITYKLGKIVKPTLKEYIDGKKMLDVEASSVSEKTFTP
ncbi:MAG: PAS domain S-box protein [Candidatus Krumholzibacteriota bacterium]|nr:PAS domain S-box protein [Candidatus Krumholzibacteriota bacterium]